MFLVRAHFTWKGMERLRTYDLNDLICPFLLYMALKYKLSKYNKETKIINEGSRWIAHIMWPNIFKISLNPFGTECSSRHRTYQLSYAYFVEKSTSRIKSRTKLRIVPQRLPDPESPRSRLHSFTNLGVHLSRINWFRLLTFVHNALFYLCRFCVLLHSEIALIPLSDCFVL